MNIGGRSYVDDEGNLVSGKTLDMIVEGPHVYIVSDFLKMPTFSITIRSTSSIQMVP